MLPLAFRHLWTTSDKICRFLFVNLDHTLIFTKTLREHVQHVQLVLWWFYRCLQWDERLLGYCLSLKLFPAILLTKSLLFLYVCPLLSFLGKCLIYDCELFYCAFCIVPLAPWKMGVSLTEVLRCKNRFHSIKSSHCKNTPPHDAAPSRLHYREGPGRWIPLPGSLWNYNNFSYIALIQKLKHTLKDKDTR